MSPSKKTFFISSLLLALTLLLWGVYYLSFKKPTDKTAEIQKKSGDEIKNAPLAPKETKSSKIFPISQEPVLSPTFLSDTHVIRYYAKKDGKAYQIDSDGNGKKVLSEKELPGFTGAYWSPDKTKVLTKFSKGDGQSQFFYYNYDISKGIPLKSNIDFVTWQNNNKIFYKYFDPSSKKRSLNLSNPDGTSWEKIADIDLKNIIISAVPQSGLVSFWPVPDAYSETSLQTASVVGQASRVLFKGKFGADYLWNDNGTKVLVSHSDAQGGTKIRLAVINDQGGEYKSLDIPTLVSKSVWSKDNKTVFYALPGSVPENAILPNDYSAGKFNTADTFWKVDTETGEKDRIVPLDKIADEFDANNLFFNYDESMLFFINRIDGKLYRIDL
jgi:hypothetical protein